MYLKLRKYCNFGTKNSLQRKRFTREKISRDDITSSVDSLISVERLHKFQWNFGNEDTVLSPPRPVSPQRLVELDYNSI